MPKIGDLELSGPFLLASMSEISTPPARLLARQCGCALAWTPMISAVHLASGEDPETEKMAEVIGGEEPVGLQIVGAGSDELSAASSRAAGLGFQTVELNASCPVRRIRAKGAGSALMKDPAALGGAASAVRSGTDLPMTVKIRLGETESSMNYLECAAAAVEAGADAVILHARAVSESYLVGAHWEHVWRLAEECEVPVGGSGSVWTAVEAADLVKQSKCEFVLVGRGAVGNPWIFSEALELLAKGELPPPPRPPEVAETMRRHFEMLVDRRGETTACRMMRSIGPAYLERVPGSDVAVATMRGVESVEAFDEICSLVALTDPGDGDESGD